MLIGHRILRNIADQPSITQCAQRPHRLWDVEESLAGECGASWLEKTNLYATGRTPFLRKPAFRRSLRHPLRYHAIVSMRINENTALSTDKLLLVPYCDHHVPTYHEWMQDADLQAATASEPLTVDEEYAMQQSWRTDHDKLTFIICLPLRHEHDPNSIEPGVHDWPNRMIGDINLFLFPSETSTPTSSTPVLIGEIELMIARPTHHRQGYGRAALVTFMTYVLANWSAIATEYFDDGASASSLPALEYLRVRINQTNERSIALFQSIGFAQVGEAANYFGEVEMRWKGVVEDVKGMRGYREVRVLRYQD